MRSNNINEIAFIRCKTNFIYFVLLRSLRVPSRYVQLLSLYSVYFFYTYVVRDI